MGDQFAKGRTQSIGVNIVAWVWIRGQTESYWLQADLRWESRLV
jgi:hypothetical protein